ncbi:hypothetical protein G9A89_016674 [Geosiphon pyriformis]|nr:hypothetical protein G9A89_016674 [Geosiphon pyriformis]
MAPAPQMAAAFFAAQTQDPNEQLINRFTANLARLLEPLAQAVRDNQQSPRPRYEPHFNQPQQSPYQRQQNCGPPVCYCCGLTEHYSRDCNNLLLSPLAPRNNDNQNNRPNNNNNVPNQRPNHANINFFGEDPLVEATGESASQPEKNPFYTFNLTNDDHDMDELAINPFEFTRKKKKAKVDFVLDPNKTSTLTTDNNEPPKAKVFKNPPKLEPPEIVQKSGPYSVVKDLMETPAHIIFGQLMTHPQFRKDLSELADNSSVTPLICKAQVAGYFIDLILNSRSSVSVIAKHFLEAIGRCCQQQREVETNWHFWECSLNTQKGKTLIDDVKNKWIQCLSEAVRGGRIVQNTDEKIVLSKEYIMSMPNVCKWAVIQAKNRLWGEYCKLQTEWEKTMGIDNRVKRNPIGGFSVDSISRNSDRVSSKPIVKVGDIYTQCNCILTDVFCGRSTMCDSIIPHRFGYTSV